MPSIALIHSGKSFMPEIAAYQHHFNNGGIKADVLVQPSQQELAPYDVLWFFMGFQPHLDAGNKNKFIVHEYCSASTPPMARLKDFVKKIINARPDLRVSLARAHRRHVFPADDIQVVFRKQGVHDCFFEKVEAEKEYDFIYTGSAQKVRRTGEWLDAFITKIPNGKILLTGNHEPGVVAKLRHHTNITFAPPVSIEELPMLLAKARFAVNYVPDVYPFNIQPSTKLLEYAAAGCSIISNKYNWVKTFASERNARFFFLDHQFENLCTDSLNKFQFQTTQMNDFKWEVIFEEMKLRELLPI